ncbi:MAG TPA: hypothetical protein VHK69_10695, partial [Chitinophagaceae bacterium]|nr:hypothetical protein [Chitinophagaceae bacterium]
IPILIECHTKQYHQYFKDIEKFLGFIQDSYGDQVEFSDLTSFQRELARHPEYIKINHGKKQPQPAGA